MAGLDPEVRAAIAQHGIRNALLTSVAAAAQTDLAMNRHAGAYVEANLGVNMYSAGIFSSEHKSVNSGINGYAFNTAVGYYLNDYFGLEGGFTRSSLKLNDSDDSSFYQNINAPYASMRFNVPIGERFSFIAKLGVMYACAVDDKHDSTDGRYIGIALPYTGIGVSYAVTPKVDLTVQYQGAVYGVVNAGVMTGGVTYHF